MKINFVFNAAVICMGLAASTVTQAQEIKTMSEADANQCQISSLIALTVTKYRDQGLTEKAANTAAFDELSKTDGNRPDLLRNIIQGRAEIAFAVREWSKESYSYFDWSVCKMKATRQRLLNFDKIRIIIKEVQACEAANRPKSDIAGWRQCIDDVVVGHAE
ncbi:hypothetical protein [Undibacterium sp. TJN19]|uniref:hypothetical protein n=1 Tax=Undibacterium sp. TJN19 TaxID=3413055 RepID=UPI003BEF83B7